MPLDWSYLPIIFLAKTGSSPALEDESGAKWLYRSRIRSRAQNLTIRAI
jgi:hypothetical protein